MACSSSAFSAFLNIIFPDDQPVLSEAFALPFHCIDLNGRRGLQEGTGPCSVGGLGPFCFSFSLSLLPTLGFGLLVGQSVLWRAK